MRNYVKAIAAFLGGITPGAVVGILALFGVHMDAVTVGTILGAVSPVLALIATWRAPANTPPTT